METLRVCWDGGGPRVVKRPLPAPRRPARRWAGAASAAARRAPARAARPRHQRSSARGPLPAAHPRMPDDGEWQCTDSAGRDLCMGGERAAGRGAPARRPGWFCGARRGGDPGARASASICRPTFPTARAPGWRCRTLYDGPARRVCDRDPGRAHAGRDLRSRATRASTAAAAPTGGASPNGPRPRAGCRPTVRAAAAASAAAWTRRRVRPTLVRGRVSLAGARRAGGGARLPRATSRCRASTACASTARRRRSGSTRRSRSRAKLVCPDLARRPRRLARRSKVRRSARDVAGARRLRADRAHAAARRASPAARSRGASSRCRRGRAARSCCARPGPTTAATRWRARSASPPPTARAACPTRRSACASTSAATAGTSTARPAGSGAALDTTGGVASLLPDVAGDWRLADGARPRARAAQRAATTRRRSTAGAPAATRRSPTPSRRAR